jgi:hypothetical protein
VSTVNNAVPILVGAAGRGLLCPSLLQPTPDVILTPDCRRLLTLIAARHRPRIKKMWATTRAISTCSQAPGPNKLR